MLSFILQFFHLSEILSVANNTGTIVFANCSLPFPRAVKAHCYTENHSRSKTIECADCGRKFQGFGGMHYHR